MPEDILLLFVGMSIVARRYQDDKSRSRSMGIAMGGGALGVLGKSSSKHGLELGVSDDHQLFQLK